MGFTTAAFIRKNTPELRKKLEELGYKDASTVQDNYTAIYTDEEEGEFFTQYLSNITDDEIAVDCGTNEELFISIAALRDDIDIHQWFTDGKEWFQCRFFKVGMHYSDKPEILFERWHKATVEELIEHFRGKEEDK
ncbi:hypothetical protein NXU87_12555 [Candidatus Bacteroides intestinigallinarum]|jgi:hypothetical protein|uniref:hypothetical protein n=1 Tax=Bacteroides TaxID=816 RepID=UPI000E89C0B1|nr:MULTISPECIES: hypothetical protein [Bacteroides]MCS3176930.1 hypothetical protein [Candidatus Bacteroides intestinigallinarum]RGN62198.1 hypothetical protein DXB58_09325 [Bacteroides sp. OM05-10AA]RGQ66522.1 hypothetical protein DWY87_10965 [Bacteroides sp. AF27-33]DAJ40738.1 MAG TPA: Flagellar hook-length control protein FliK [Caudoviricetes sp.]